MTSLLGYSDSRPLGVARDNQGRSRAATIGLWVLQVASAAMFLAAGSSKLLGAGAMVQMFAAVGLGQWFRYLTGAVEVISALLLLVPSLAFFGAVALIPTMIGAVITHIFVIGGSPAPAIFLLAATSTVAWIRRPR
jgi:putative oxidoreductase